MDWVTPGGACVTYQWGDFKHDPIEVLTRYFDAFLYTSNWGTHQLAFRFGLDQIDPDAFTPYLLGDLIDLVKIKTDYILTVEVRREDGGFADEGWYDEDEDEDEDESEFAPNRLDEFYDPEHLLSGIAPIRDQILNGDFRALYLLWLAQIDLGAVSRPQRLAEPPVPAGLTTLTAAHETLIAFLGPSPELLAVAQAGSPAQTIAEPDWSPWLKHLPPKRREHYLERLAQNEPGLGAALQRELRTLAGVKPAAAPATRTAAQLLQAAQAERDRREKAAAVARQQAAEAAAAVARAKREAELKRLNQRGEQVWDDVQAHIALRNKPGYDAAEDLLGKLRDLAEQQQRLPAFHARIDALLTQYERRPALVERLRRLRQR